MRARARESERAYAPKRECRSCAGLGSFWNDGREESALDWGEVPVKGLTSQPMERRSETGDEVHTGCIVGYR